MLAAASSTSSVTLRLSRAVARPHSSASPSKACLLSAARRTLTQRLPLRANATLTHPETMDEEENEIEKFEALDVPTDPKPSKTPLAAAKADSGVEMVKYRTSRFLTGQFDESTSNGFMPKDTFEWNIPDSVWLTGAPQMWVDGHFGQSVVVGVIDSGIDRTHPCLKGRVVKQYDYTGENIPPYEYGGHGTHVAGTIGAFPVSEEHNLVGVAPGVVFHDYRVFPKNGGASYTTIAKAIRQATKDGCDIINMSLGGPGSNRDLHNAIKEARAAGVTIICAGGNEGKGKSIQDILRRDEISFPAYYPETLAVACINLNLSKGKVDYIYFSNTNKRVDVAADGYKLISCWPKSQYLTISGTSMATPCVTGMAALLFSRIAERSGKAVAREINMHALLKAEAVDVFDGSGNRNNIAGYGLCTLLSEVPAYEDGEWFLPNLSYGSPVA